MKKYLFLFILLFNFTVFAASKDVTSYIKYSTDSASGTYKGDEIAMGGYNGIFDVQTRYNGRLSLIEFFLPASAFSFNTDTVYTITLNMATNDWRNYFMGPQVIKANSNGSLQSTNGSLSVSNFQFVSRKTIKFNFKTNSSISPYLFFRLYSTTYASTNSTAITGDDNWNLYSIVISDGTSSGSGTSNSGGSSSSGSSTNGGSSSTNGQLTCSNGLTLSSRIYTYNNATTDNYYLNDQGQKLPYNGYYIVENVPISNNTSYLLTRTNNTDDVASYCLYDSNHTLIRCQAYGNVTYFYFDSLQASFISFSIKTGTMTLSSCVSAIDSANQNTQDIIDNQNDNTSTIIQNNNDNTQQIIDSNKVCKRYDKSNSLINNKYLNINGVLTDNSNYIVTDFINIESSSVKVLLPISNTSSPSLCYYNINKSLISCTNNNQLTQNSLLTIPNNASFIRFSINKTLNLPTFEVCKNGNQALTDSLTDDNVSSSTGSGFFDNFTNNDFGLSSIITLPLTTIQSLTSSSCVTLSVPIPFTNSTVSLPCMTQVYQQFIPTIFTLWQTVTFGLLAYFIALDIFKIVKGFKSPDEDKIEVLDL